MKNKNQHKFYLVFFLQLMLQSGANAKNEYIDSWLSGPQACYASMKSYLLEAYGPNYSEDENIRTYSLPFIDDRKRESPSEFIWARDFTPSINTSGVLFEVFESGMVCAVLDAPAADNVSLMKINKQGLPKYVTTIDRPPNGMPTHQVIYRLFSKSKYRPYKCFKVTRSIKKSVSCRNIFM